MKDDAICAGIQGIVSAYWYKDNLINDVSVTKEGAQQILNYVRQAEGMYKGNQPLEDPPLNDKSD